MTAIRNLLLPLILIAAVSGPVTAETPKLRIAVLKFGTVNWLMDTVLGHGLDEKEGYRLEVIGLAGTPATAIAFQSGDADMLVTDWFWALRQRQEGADLRFSPYSTSLGALMTRGDVTEVCDLRNRSLGIVGGPFDKSWLIFQAVIRKRCGFEADAGNQVLFGAPPLIARQLDAGRVDAVSTFWHWAARLEATGKFRLLGVTEAMAELGIAPAPSLIGFVWNAARTDGKLVQAFLRSVEAARSRLRSDDEAWEPLRGRMKAGDEATFSMLRQRFRDGIPPAWTGEHTAVAERLHTFLTDEAPQGFASKAGRFDPGVFLPPQ